MIEFLFLDLDDTILDFHKAERIAISKTIREFGVEPTEDILNLYHGINKWHWEQLEQGKLTRGEVLVNRFGVLFKKLGLEVDAPKCAKTYEINLSEIEPTVSCPHLPENTKPIGSLSEIKIDQAVIGSCTNGRLSDLAAAAVNQHLDLVCSQRADALFRAAVNLVETDADYMDYESHRRALVFMAELKDKPASAFPLTGKFNQAGNTFSIDQACRELIQSVYGAPADKA